MSNTGQFDAFAFLYLNPSLNLQSVEDAYTFALSNSNDAVGLLSNLSGIPNTFTTNVFIADNRDIINISGLNTAIKQSMLAEGFSSNTIDAGGKYYSTIFRDINLVGSNTFAFSNQYPYTNSNFLISVSNLQVGDKVKIQQNSEGYFYANVLSVDSNATPNAFTFSMLYQNEPLPVYTGSNPDSNSYNLIGIKLFDADRLARIEYLRLSSNNPYVVANLPTDEFNYELYKIIYPDTRLLTPEDAFENYKSYLGTPAFRVAQFQDLKNFQGLTGFCNIGGTNMTTIIPFTMCNTVTINPPATLSINCPAFFNGSMQINDFSSSNGKIIHFTACNALLYDSCNISFYASNANIDDLVVNYNAAISNVFVSGLANFCNMQANQVAMSNVAIDTLAVSNMTARNCAISNGYVASLNASNSYFVEEHASNIYASNIYVSTSYTSNVYAIDSYLSNVYAKDLAISNVNVSGSTGISNLYALNSLTSNAAISVLAASNSYLFNTNASNFYAIDSYLSNAHINLLNSTLVNINNLYNSNSYTSNLFASNAAISNMDVNIMNSDWNYGANFVISDFGVLGTLSNGAIDSNQVFDNVLINQTLGVTGQTSMGRVGVTTNDVMLTCHGMIEATNLNPTSDIRLKQNVNYQTPVMQNALDLVNKLKPCEYEYKHKNAGTPKFGFIADEVQDVLPSIVGEIPSYISYIDKEIVPLSRSIMQNDGFNLDIGDIICINGKQYTVINVSDKGNTFKIHPPLEAGDNEVGGNEPIILKGVLYDKIKMIDQLQMIPLLVSAIQQLTQMVHQLSFSGKSDV